MINMPTFFLFSGTNTAFSQNSLSLLYETYAPVIDFLIYMALFIGIAHATLGRQFPARSGRMVSVATGVMLAVGLAASEQAFGFNLRVIGPVAAAVVFLLLVIALYQGAKTAGVDVFVSCAVTVIVVSLLLSAVMPAHVEQLLDSSFSGLFLLVLVTAVGVMVYKLFSALFRHRYGLWDAPALLRNRWGSDKPKEWLNHFRNEMKEADVIKNRVEKITQSAEQTSRQILDGMFDLKTIVSQGNNPKSRYLIEKNLEQIAPKEHKVFRTLLSLKDVLKKLSAFDIEHFEKLKADYDTVSSNVKKHMKHEFIDEWKKLGLEKDLRRLDTAASASNRDFTRAVTMLVRSLRNNRPEDARTWLDKSIACEKKIVLLLKDMKILEKKLLKQTKHEIRDEKKQLRAQKN